LPKGIKDGWVSSYSSPDPFSDQQRRGKYLNRIIVNLGIKLKTSTNAKYTARYLRKSQTPAEEILWEKLRNRNFAGLKFTRQHPIYYFKDKQKKFFIADFYCHRLKLIIELDGEIHKKQKNYDILREELLKNKSLKIIRFKNTKIEENINLVLIRLKRYIDTLSN
jgi:very-short-patch-repair endonuclease